MIPLNTVDVHLMRLNRLDFFPRPNPGDEWANAGYRELREALQVADTAEIAALVVTQWLKENGECPKPADLRLACHAENARRKPDEALQRIAGWKAGKDAGYGQAPAVRALMDEHWAVLNARQDELRKVPAAAKWHQREDGSVERMPTALSMRLAEIAGMLA